MKLHVLFYATQCDFGTLTMHDDPDVPLRVGTIAGRAGLLTDSNSLTTGDHLTEGAI